MIVLKEVGKILTSGGRPLTVLHPLTLTIEKGRFVAVMGPSGSGKSTLLGLIAGLDAPTAGEIWVSNKQVSRMNEDDLARFRSRSVGFVFQSFQLIPNLTALENVLVPMEIRGQAGARPRAEELLAMVGLGARGSHYPAQLSGGEQQRVAIARAFACRPEVLLADEPTGNLDSATTGEVLELLRRFHEERGQTTVLVTHDAEVSSACTRVLSMLDGVILGSNRDKADPEEDGAI